MTVRNSPSGPEVDALVSGDVKTQFGWTPLTGPNSNLLVLQPAGHMPGIYLISYVYIVRAVASGGTGGTPAISWTSPLFGAELKAGQAVTMGALGTVIGASGTTAGPRPIAIVSAGTAPITIQFFPNALTGTPLVDLYASASLVTPL